MNVLAIAVASALVAGAGVAGYVAWDIWDEVLPKCEGEERDSPGGDRLVRYTLTNHGEEASIRLCVQTTDGDIVALDALRLGEGATTTVQWRLPEAMYHFVAELTDGGGHAVSTLGIDLATCRVDVVEMESTFEVYATGASLSAGPSNCSPETFHGEGHSMVHSASLGRSEDAPVAAGRQIQVPPGVVAAGVSGALVAIPALRYKGALGYLAAAGFTRLVKPRLLDQRVRSLIHQLVGADPGVQPSDVMRRLELGAGTVAHHLRVLSREGLLTSVRVGLTRHYFLVGSCAPADMRRLALLRDDKLGREYRALASRPGLTLTEFAGSAGYSVARASKAAQRLERVGLARRERQGRTVRLFPLLG